MYFPLGYFYLLPKGLNSIKCTDKISQNLCPVPRPYRCSLSETPVDDTVVY